MDLVERALARSGARTAPAALFTHEAKRLEPGLIEAAERLGLPLVFLDQARLREASPRAVTTSAKVMALFTLPSIAETAALAGAGPGADLLVPRISAAGASCAVAGVCPGEANAAAKGRDL